MSATTDMPAAHCALPALRGAPAGVERRSATCGACLVDPPHFDAADRSRRLRAAARRDGLALKFGARSCTSRRPSAASSRTAARHGARWQAVVPLPLAFEQQSARGFNQSVELARPLARSLGIPLADDVLLRTRRDGAATPAGARATDGATCAARSPWSPTARARIDGADLLLVDDVMTSGATLDAASAALKAAGAVRVTAACRRAHALSGGRDCTARGRRVQHRPGRAGDSAEHRQRDPAGGEHRRAAAPGAAAGFEPRRQATAARRPRLSRVRRASSCTRLRMRCCDAKRPTPTRMFALHDARRTACSARSLFAAGDWLVFGAETRGLDPAVRDRFARRSGCACRCEPGNRSLNLSNAVAIVVFEAWRQLGLRWRPMSSPSACREPTGVPRGGCEPSWRRATAAVRAAGRRPVDDQQVPVLGPDEPSSRRVAQELEQPVEVARDVDDADRLGVQLQLQPGQHLEHFLERAVAAGQHDERIGTRRPSCACACASSRRRSARRASGAQPRAASGARESRQRRARRAASAASATRPSCRCARRRRPS